MVFCGDRSTINDVPFLHLERLGRDPEDAGRPVEVAVNHLHRRVAGRWCRGLDGRDLVLDRDRIVFGKGDLASLAAPDAAGAPAARRHDDEIRAETLDLLRHAGMSACAHGHHGDDRSHPDDDAEHRERASELVDA